MSHKFKEVLIRHVAPTLNKIKVGNLINVSKKEFPEVIDYINELNNINNVCCKILKKFKNSYLILIYNYDLLDKNLKIKENKEFLNNYGYVYNNVDEAIEYLKSRIKNDDFPHEIGLFLDYPLEDIIGFINNDECLYTGYWKVYKNVLEKINIFNKYNECIVDSLNKLHQGINIIGG